MNDIQLYTKISSLPEELKQQVWDFVTSLKNEPRTPLNERKFGMAKGFFTMADDFDEPLEDFKDYM